MLFWDNAWESLYDLLGIRDFIYFISSPALQDKLFGVKLVFMLFTVFFLCAVVYFYLNSSYLRYQFLQDAAEFLSWQSYGMREVHKKWKRIIKNTEFGGEQSYKLAIIEADDFLRDVLFDRGYKGDTVEELANNAGPAAVPDYENVLKAHAMRNAIVYDPNYKLDIGEAQKILSVYERAIKIISAS